MELVGARAGARPEGRLSLPGKVHSFTGNDPSRWHTDIPTWRRIAVDSVYPGIDVVFYGNQRELEYDFIVAPGADPTRVQLAFDGARAMSVGPEGELVLDLAGGRLVQHAPVVVERREGGHRRIACSYRLLGQGRVGLALGKHDPAAELLIDPVFAYASYFGGVHPEATTGIAVDAAGSAYFTGWTSSPDLPITSGALAKMSSGGDDAFVVKLDPSGLSPVYSTYLGGIGPDEGRAIAVDAAGNAYVAGNTTSTNFPVQGALDATYNSPPGDVFGDVFVAKLGPTGGTLVYSTYVGGSDGDWAEAIALDASGNLHVTGSTYSADFPTQAAVQSTHGSAGVETDAFAFKLNAAGTALLYSTFLGGESRDDGRAVAVDSQGNAVIGGYVGLGSSSFPLKDAIQSTTSTGFVTRLTPAGALSYSTRLGSSGVTDRVNAVAVDAKDAVIAVGETDSNDFPVTKTAYQKKLATAATCKDGGGCPDAFLARLTPDGKSIDYATYLGGTGADRAFAVAVSADGYIHVGGDTDSEDLPTPGAAQKSYGGDPKDIFLARFSAGGALVNATYLGGTDSDTMGDDLFPPLGSGGIAVDPNGDVYLSGATSSTDFPLKNPFQSKPGGLGDALLAKLAYSAGASGPVEPAVGGNIGFLTVTVHGKAFGAGATFRLTRAGEEDVAALRATVAADGASITGVLDLRGVKLGDWDVVAGMPGGEIVYADGFTVEAGRAPDVWLELAGRSQVRVGREATITVVYGNRGNVDAMVIPLWLSGFPADADVRVDTAITPLPAPAGLDAATWSAATPILKGKEDTKVGVVAPRIPAGGSGILRIAYTPKTIEPITIRGWASHSFIDEPSALPKVLSTSGPLGCFLSVAGAVVGLLPGGQCVLDLGKVGGSGLAGTSAISKYLAGTVFLDIPSITVSAYTEQSTVVSTTQVVVGAFGVLAACAGKDILGKVLVGTGLVLSAVNVYGDCKGEIFRKLPVDVRTSVDPNDKVGVIGGGEAHAIRGDIPLAYQIFFENEPTASAAAQQVVVTDTLAPDLDLSLLSLGRITVADQSVDPPPGATQHNAELDLVASQGVKVTIDAKLDKVARKLTWTFAAVDSVTGLPPADPTVGFLPPDDGDGNGEGSVLLLVNPAAGLPTGTQIANGAKIVFDANGAIDTPVWSNVIDNDPPESLIVPRAKTSATTELDVAWGGVDKGSGIASYDVYTSVNGGKFIGWQTGAVETSASYQGNPGDEVAFAVIAYDFAGNREKKNLGPELTVTVDANASAMPAANGSCGCRTSGSPAEGTAWLLGALAAVAAGWRRRSVGVRRAAPHRPQGPLEEQRFLGRVRERPRVRARAGQCRARPRAPG
jgi:MYXO-CTERM domain-containing protein